MSENVHLGHRMRMRRKLAEYGENIFDSYELLEMLLYFSVPVKNTNPIAKALLSRFGSLEGVFRASVEELTEVAHVGEKSAKLIYDVGRVFVTDTDNRENINELSTYDIMGKYLVEKFRDRKEYAIGLLSLDSGMGFIAFDELYPYDFSSAAVRPKEFIDTVLRRSASVAVIVHNHPNGPLYPSEGDMQTNFLIKDALESVGVILAEHYVVTGERYVGFMNHISAFTDVDAFGRFVKSKAEGGQFGKGTFQ